LPLLRLKDTVVENLMYSAIVLVEESLFIMCDCFYMLDIVRLSNLVDNRGSVCSHYVCVNPIEVISGGRGLWKLEYHQCIFEAYKHWKHIEFAFEHETNLSTMPCAN